MVEDLYVAGFCLFISAAGATVAYFLSRKTFEETVARVAELSGRIEKARSESAEMMQGIASTKAGLETKITRNAMQIVTRQAKDLTAAVIDGS